MAEPTPIRQPSLIVVTGRPGSGKTTLAHALARAIRCPAVCRDEIKEGFMNTTGQASQASQAAQPGDEIGRRVYEAFFDTIRLLLGHHVTLVAEAAFQHKLWAPKLEPLREIARMRIVLCEVDPALADSRQHQRFIADPSRARFHPPIQVPMAGYESPRLDVPLLTVDTSDEYRPDFDAIVSFAGG
jgi:predicted kinase